VKTCLGFCIQELSFLQQIYKSFKNIKLDRFLKSRIRIQINLINSIVDDIETGLDTYAAGTLIAEANNDTQKVRADDIFGNKYKNDLEEYIFSDFNEQ